MCTSLQSSDRLANADHVRLGDRPRPRPELLADRDVLVVPDLPHRSSLSSSSADALRAPRTPRTPCRAALPSPRRSRRSPARAPRAPAPRPSASGRGRARSIVISRTIRPGDGDMTTTRSDRPTASSMLCVMNSTVCRSDSQSRSRSSADLEPGQRIERPERLVHQEDGRAVHQRARQRHALAHAARELPRIPIGARAPRRAAPAARPRGPARRACRAAGCVPAAARCRARSGTRAGGRPGTRCPTSVSGAVSARPATRITPRRRREQSGGHEHQGALAAAARADHAHELAGPDAERRSPSGPGRPASRRSGTPS